MFANSDDVLFVGGAYLVAENLSFQVAVYGTHGMKEVKKNKLLLSLYFKTIN